MHDAAIIRREWLETDGLGGFGMGTVSGIRTRRYHGLLIAAGAAPSERTMLLNGLDVWIETISGRFGLSPQRYAPDVVHPDGDVTLVSFEHEPWPRWRWRVRDGTIIEHELFMRHGQSAIAMSWRVVNGSPACRLTVRPLMSARSYHALEREDARCDLSPRLDQGELVWRLRHVSPELRITASGRYEHAPCWYRQFQYDVERDRGFDCTEDLASPGQFNFDLAAGEAVLVARAAAAPREPSASGAQAHATSQLHAMRHAELVRRRSFRSPMARAADMYIVRRGGGKTLIAGYPWFTDWGRDTFIAMRGLCLATGRLDDARSILSTWAMQVSEGMLPNRFADGGDEAEFNAVDASLWFVIAAHEFLHDAGESGVSAGDRRMIESAMLRIVHGYARGTRYGIGMGADGLLAAGVPGQQLTWMDARVDGREITPRIGKPVELQALWINAMLIAAEREPMWRAVAMRAAAEFQRRFWNERYGCLYDVIDVDHMHGAVDSRIRPNQILAVGGLPQALIRGDRARQLVDVVERELWTPLGLRTLARSDDDYVGHYAGGPAARDAAYHQGTTWPWLLGPFVDAWLRARGADDHARHEATHRFLLPLRQHLGEAGLGHVSEIADGDPPHRADGCPFQAWSLGELIRIERMLRGADESAPLEAFDREAAAA